MNKHDRIYQLDQFFKARHFPSEIKFICAALQCSKASAHRYINELRDNYGAPIENHGNGFCYNAREPLIKFGRVDLCVRIFQRKA